MKIWFCGTSNLSQCSEDLMSGVSSVPVLGGFCVVRLESFTVFERFDVVCCECLSVLSGLIAACFECFAVLQYCGLKCSAVTGGFVFWVP